MSTALEALQSQFAAGILRNEGRILDALRAESRAGAAQRFDIYYEAYRARLADALADSFAHTARALGDGAFRALAAEYIDAHCPTEPSIRWYGESFPAWLSAAHPQLAELAALDWALRSAFDGADAEPLDAAALAALGAEDWERIGFVLCPTFRLLVQRWNTVARWQALDDGHAPPAAVELAQPRAVAVWRKGLQPHFRTLDAGEDGALRALHEGLRFGEVCTRLAASRTPQDAAALAGGWLRRWIDEELLVGLRAGRAPPRPRTCR